MFLDKPENVHNVVINNDTDGLLLFHKELAFIVKNSHYETFYSKYVPDVPKASWVAFSFYKSEPYVTVSYKDGSIYTNVISQDVGKYVFTNCMLDLNTLTPVDLDDSIKRIAKEKSR